MRVYQLCTMHSAENDRVIDQKNSKEKEKKRNPHPIPYPHEKQRRRLVYSRRRCPVDAVHDPVQCCPVRCRPTSLVVVRPVVVGVAMVLGPGAALAGLVRAAREGCCCKGKSKEDTRSSYKINNAETPNVVFPVA